MEPEGEIDGALPAAGPAVVRREGGRAGHAARSPIATELVPEDSSRKAGSIKERHPRLLSPAEVGSLAELTEEVEVQGDENPNVASQGIDEDEYPTIKSGDVDLKNPVKHDSEMYKLQERQEWCLQENPLGECMEQLGSYTVKRLMETGPNKVDNVVFNFSDWMAHKEVKKQPIFNLTLPGTHVSAGYDFVGEHANLGKFMSYGILLQKHSIMKQLHMGIRFFDIRCAWSFREKRVYAAYGLMLRPLEDILKQIRDFLSKYRSEIIVISLKKAKNIGKYSKSYIQTLLDDEMSNQTVPGQTVHLEIRRILGRFLTTYQGLSFLDENANHQNPSVGELAAIGRNVVYFWEGQQVLCLDRQLCSMTPGWLPPSQSLPLAFGPPLAEGERQKYFEMTKKTIIDPGCIHSSWKRSKSSVAEDLITNIETFCKRMREDVMQKPLTPCFAPLAPIPMPGDPPLLYQADVMISLEPHEQAKQQALMRDKANVWRQGESYTKTSDAERVNYLFLTWLMSRDNAAVYLKPSFYVFDFAHPVVVQRIIEAVQKRKDCGFALYCKDTGSCWAKSLLPRDSDNCLDEKDEMLKIEVESGEITKPHLFASKYGMAAFLACSLCIKLFIFCCCCRLCGYEATPYLSRKDGLSIVWPARRPPEASPAAAPPAAAPAAEGGAPVVEGAAAS